MRAPEPDDPRTDGELARRIAAGPAGDAAREEAELCRRFLPRVSSYGLRHLHDPHAAADLAQHVLLLTLQKLRAGEVHDPDRIASFVLGVARLAAGEQRRTARHQTADADVLAQLAAPAPPDLDLERLQACLAALPERQRAVIVLTFYGGCRAAEIGARLDASEGNVRVVRHRALARLHACMDLPAEDAP